MFRRASDTSVKNPMHRPFGKDILIIDYKVSLFPDIAKEAIHASLTQILSAIQPIRAQNSNLKLCSSTLFVRIQRVEEGSAVVPFEVVEQLAQLALNDVEVSAVGPVVPEIDHFERPVVIHPQY